jgi:FMN phosphatase YigB (HAD superfamily)
VIPLGDEILRHVAQVINTFDVFDTVLARRVVDPRSLFDFVGWTLDADGLLQVDRSRFRAHREACELEVAARSSGKQPRLIDIYTELGRRGVIAADVSTALSVELAWELELAAALPCTELDELRGAKTPVHFLSDTPHTATFLAELLRSVGILVEGDSVLTSADIGAGKRDGSMFIHFAQTLGCDLAAIRHLGNHAYSDVSAPRKLGVQSGLLPIGNPSPFEEQLERLTSATLLASLLAGASRLTRAELARVPPEYQAIVDVMAGVGAPQTWIFSLWVLEEARRNEIERVYFVSRDGQRPLVMAERLQGLFGTTPIDLRYLRGSRLAWHRAAFESFDEHARSWIFAGSAQMSLRDLAGRLGLSEHALLQTVPELRRLDPTRPLGEDSKLAVELMAASQPLEEAIVLAAKEQRALAIDYLRYQGLTEDGVRSAVVDLGPVGRLARSLERLVALAGGQSPMTLTYSLSPEAADVGPASCRAFYFDGRMSGASVPPEVEWMEFFCLADHGQVVGYFRDQDGSIQPQVGPDDPALEQWGREWVVATSDAFSRHIAASLAQVCALPLHSSPELPVLARYIWTQWLSVLTPEQLAVWGSFPHNSSQEAQAGIEIAPPGPLARGPQCPRGMARSPGGAGNPSEAKFQGDPAGVASSQGCRNWRTETDEEVSLMRPVSAGMGPDFAKHSHGTFPIEVQS